MKNVRETDISQAALSLAEKLVFDGSENVEELRWETAAMLRTLVDLIDYDTAVIARMSGHAKKPNAT